jgi:hypothetical protein
MGKPGRKPKPGKREPNGKPQRPTQAVLNEITKREAMKVKNVVLMQPHRRGQESEHCVTALGRLWLRMNTPNKVILHAGEHYAGLVRRWRAAHGMASAHAPEESTGTGDGPAWSTVQGWLRDIRQIEKLLDGLGVMSAVARVVLDDLDPIDRNAEIAAVMGLRAIAIEVNMLGKDHPFR